MKSERRLPHWFSLGLLSCLAASALGGDLPATAAASKLGKFKILSNGPKKLPSNGGSFHTSISRDGRFVAFASSATNLIPNLSASQTEVYLYDRVKKKLQWISRGMSGGPANASSTECRISGDGRFVVFTSGASDLVPNDSNGVSDVFCYDRIKGSTERVSIHSDDSQGTLGSMHPAISNDGNVIAFESSHAFASGGVDGLVNIYVRVRNEHSTICVSLTSTFMPADADAFGAVLSGSGYVVAFQSNSTNMMPTNGFPGINTYVFEIPSGHLARVNAAANGTPMDDVSFPTAMDDSGRYLVYSSPATNIAIHDDNDKWDVFVYDAVTGNSECVSRMPGGAEGAEGNDDSDFGTISADGRYVAFTSRSSNFIGGDGAGVDDIFLKDRETLGLTWISRGVDGQTSNLPSYEPMISGDGRFLTCSSNATNLTLGDTNGFPDIFLVKIR